MRKCGDAGAPFLRRSFRTACDAGSLTRAPSVTWAPGRSNHECGSAATATEMVGSVGLDQSLTT